MLQAFLNNEKIKQKYVKRVKAHYRADEIVQGIYWEKGKGCAVGCTIEYDGGKNDNWHQRFEDKLGVPQVLARLEDRIFEGLENKEAKEFPLHFLEAINVGADLHIVFYQFMHWLLVDPKDGVVKYARPDGKKAIRAVAKLFQRKIEGEEIDLETLMEARTNAAAAYAADAAYAAANVTAAYAAVTAYAADTAYAAASRMHYKKMADKLIELLKNVKVTYI